MGLLYDNNMDINKIQSVKNGYYHMEDRNEIMYVFEVIVGD